MTSLNPFDNALFPLLNRGAVNPFFDWLMPRITNLHQNRWFMGLVLLACLVLAIKGDRRVRVWLLCAVLAVGISDPLAARVVKNLMPRTRPCQMVSDGFRERFGFFGVRLVPGTNCPGSKSFPSNHASNMMALAGVCWWFSRRTKDRGPRTEERTTQGPDDPTTQRPAALLWFLLPLVIGYSRIYLGFHYPTDVVGGWLLGAIISVGVLHLVARPLLQREREKEVTNEQPDQEVSVPPVS